MEKTVETATSGGANMKFQAGILGLEDEICRQLQSLLAYHRSIEIKPLCQDAQKGLNISAPLRGLDFVFCTDRPGNAHYSASIRQAILADIPVVAFCGYVDANLPILEIDCISEAEFCKNIPLRSYRRGICIVSKENCENSADLLVKLAESAIRRSYLTQRQSVYYP